MTLLGLNQNADMTDPPLNYYHSRPGGRPDFVQNVNVLTWDKERKKRKGKGGGGEETKLRTNAEMLMSTLF